MNIGYMSKSTSLNLLKRIAASEPRYTPKYRDLMGEINRRRTYAGLN